MRRTLIALAFCGTLVACGSGGETPQAEGSTPPASTTPSPTAAQTTPLDGTITVSYSIEDMRRAGISEHERCENAGTHEITLTAGSWTFKQTPLSECGSVIAGSGSGSFTASGDVVTFTEPGAFGCSETYSYRFAIAGSTVTFTTVEDDCEPRRVIMTTRSWTRIR